MNAVTAVVITGPQREQDPIASRIPTFLHPLAGRPLVWHTVNAIASAATERARIVVVASAELSEALFDGMPADVEVVRPGSTGAVSEALDAAAAPVLAVHASASLDGVNLGRLLEAEPDSWIGNGDGVAAAVLVRPSSLETMLVQERPFELSSGILDPSRRLSSTPGTFVVRTRADLARAHLRIRDRLVHAQMDVGVTFLLPDSVTLDVDVRIGRDTIIYPGVVLEGQTTIGEETVVGPGCRIIDSWIGSGVELKGWNYIAHTSLRNRAILEPYVRRGFD